MKSDNVHIILSHPFTADNIGAAARAIKNMGFSKLRLVAPRRNWRKRARVLACNAQDVLSAAEVYDSLEEAVVDLNWTAGTTCRLSAQRGKFISFNGFVETVQKKSSALKMGVVFGCEAKGLNNAELKCCDYLVSLPADEKYPSLNLAQAVMVTVFSLAQKKLAGSSQMGLYTADTSTLVDKRGIQSALLQMEEALKSVGFYGGKKGKLDRIMKVTEGFFKRAGMHHYEAQMIKGVSSRIVQRMSEKKRGA